MSDRFVVEADRRVVGVAVRVPGGFKFFSSDPEYFVLDGKLFARARAMVGRIAQLARRKSRPGRSRSAGWRQ